jgi:NhaP-type Na+/H+ or K+/H+ antiporter
MLTSLALIFLLGLMLGSIFQKLKLPSLVGMLLTGMILSPYALNLLDDSILSISPDLRKLALVIILTRAGLAMDMEDLKKVGRPAVLMCFIPASFEILGVVVLAPKLLGVSIIEAAVIGTVLAAVSPAVIVPRMLKLMDKGYGIKNSIPQLIMAGGSVDDVYVIVLFTSFTALAGGGPIDESRFLEIPIAIVTGILLGIVLGILSVKFFKLFHMRDSVKVLILLSIAFLLIALETNLEHILPVSGLIGVVSMSATILKKYGLLAKRLSLKFNKLWVAAEVLLFVLVGATVDLKYVQAAGIQAVLLIFGALVFRMVGVWVSLLKTQLTTKERLFCMIAYTPKATVQAAIGAVPLSMGLNAGHIILTVAVLSILITAPLGAVGIDRTYKKLLENDEK